VEGSGTAAAISDNSRRRAGGGHRDINDVAIRCFTVACFLAPQAIFLMTGYRSTRFYLKPSKSLSILIEQVSTIYRSGIIGFNHNNPWFFGSIGYPFMFGFEDLNFDRNGFPSLRG
jgi:hypothetical protein